MNLFTYYSFWWSMLIPSCQCNLRKPLFFAVFHLQKYCWAFKSTSTMVWLCKKMVVFRGKTFSRKIIREKQHFDFVPAFLWFGTFWQSFRQGLLISNSSAINQKLYCFVQVTFINWQLSMHIKLLCKSGHCASLHLPFSLENCY